MHDYEAVHITSSSYASEKRRETPLLLLEQETVHYPVKKTKPRIPVKHPQKMQEGKYFVVLLLILYFCHAQKNASKVCKLFAMGIELIARSSVSFYEPIRFQSFHSTTKTC
jgi:hypothetical protein